MNKNFQIRHGKLTDVDQVTNLWHEMVEYHQSITTLDFEMIEEAPKLFEKYYKTHVRSKNKIAMVAVDIQNDNDNDKIIGYLLSSKEKRPPVFKKQYHGFVTDICVTEKMRNKGIGSALMEGYIYWAKEHGLDYLMLHVDAKNEVGLRFYNKLDFETILQVKKKNI